MHAWLDVAWVQWNGMWLECWSHVKWMLLNGCRMSWDYDLASSMLYVLDWSGVEWSGFWCPVVSVVSYAMHYGLVWCGVLVVWYFWLLDAQWILMDDSSPMISAWTSQDLWACDDKFVQDKWSSVTFYYIIRFLWSLCLMYVEYCMRSWTLHPCKGLEGSCNVVCVVCLWHVSWI